MRFTRQRGSALLVSMVLTVAVGGTAVIDLAEGASLTIHRSSAGDVHLTGTAFCGDTDRYAAPTLQIFSGGNNLQLSGGGGVDENFIGAIHAPDSEILFVGNYKGYGSFVANTITFAGTVDYHYDEALGREASSDVAYPQTYWLRQ